MPTSAAAICQTELNNSGKIPCELDWSGVCELCHSGGETMNRMRKLWPEGELGFTLVELLIVCLIIGIVAGVVIYFASMPVLE
jgi:prepilin-type N-terminal cleavage/methylation domain-containing protein